MGPRTLVAPARQGHPKPQVIKPVDEPTWHQLVPLARQAAAAAGGSESGWVVVWRSGPYRIRWQGPGGQPHRGLLRRLPGGLRHALESQSPQLLPGDQARPLALPWQPAWMLVLPLPPSDGARGGVVIGCPSLPTTERALAAAQALWRLPAPEPAPGRLEWLAGAVAHEVRNPLSAIKAAAQYLAGRHQDDLTGRFLAMIEEEADRLARFTSSLLAYARPRQVSHQPLQLARLVGQAWEAVAGQAHKAGVSLTFLPGPDLPPVAGEPELVRAAIANVLLNAVQAMASGGEVVVRLQAGADRVRVVVTDQGPGLPPGLRRLVWEPFFTTKRQGSGLGLALVKKIIDLHGGQVRIGSRPGRGTTVVLALPAGPLAR